MFSHGIKKGLLTSDTMFYHVLPGQKKHVEMWCFTVDDKLVSNLHMYTINPSEIGAIGVIKEVINHVNIQVIRP